MATRRRFAPRGAFVRGISAARVEPTDLAGVRRGAFGTALSLPGNPATCADGLRWTELLKLCSCHVQEPPVANVFNRALEALV